MRTPWHIPSSEVTLAHPDPAILAECPLWSPTELVLYFVDIAGQMILQFNPKTHKISRWSAPEEPGCLCLVGEGDEGELMVALRSGFARFNTKTGIWGEKILVDHDTQNFRFNDGRCDAAGRFWAGTMYEPRTAALGCLYALEQGRVKKIMSPENNRGVKVSNGLAFDVARGYLYHSDTPNHTVWRYRYDADSGEVGERTIFATMDDARQKPDYGGRPDGGAVDSEGCYWSAQFEGGRLLRFTPDGEINGVVDLPVRRPTMMAFGDGDLRTLYITTSAENITPEERERFPWSGCLLKVPVPMQGLIEPCYRP